MKPTLDRALQEACEVQSQAPLLEQLLDPAVQLLHSHLHTLNFQRFLWSLWEALIMLFEDTVNRNAEVIVHSLLLFTFLTMSFSNVALCYDAFLSTCYFHISQFLRRKAFLHLNDVV